MVNAKDMIEKIANYGLPLKYNRISMIGETIRIFVGNQDDGNHWINILDKYCVGPLHIIRAYNLNADVYYQDWCVIGELDNDECPTCHRSLNK